MAKTFGTLNLTDAELGRMEKHPNQKAIDYGKSVPYYLQYIRKQKEKENEEKKN